MKTIDCRKLITETCRILLGITFLFSGTVKCIDPAGGAIKMEEYFQAFGLSVLSPLALPVSSALSAFEFALGLCILTGVYRRLTTVCMLAFMSFMTLLSLYLAIFNPVHDCGCFGEALIITNLQTFLKNALILLPASIVTCLYHKRITPLYTRKAYRLILLFAFAFPIWFSWYNYAHLPLKDFRPYKIGANIPALMSFPQDAPRDEYRYVYEKNGKKKDFAPEDVPAGDSTWTFIEAKLIREGYVPPITSFELYNSAGDNVAPELLSDENGLFLLIAPKIEQASDRKTDQINHICDYAREHQLDFYCVTASAPEEINDWINNTGAEYPFLTADDVTLKTVIRSNPGLVLLKNGTILNKWHYNDIPSEDRAEAVMNSLLHPASPTTDKRSDKDVDPRPTSRTAAWMISLFTLPLLLVWICDYLRNGRKKK